MFDSDSCTSTLKQVGIWSHIQRAMFSACLLYTSGRSVLVVQIEESDRKPVYAKDETGKYLAYLRIKDENILAKNMIIIII